MSEPALDLLLTNGNKTVSETNRLFLTIYAASVWSRVRRHFRCSGISASTSRDELAFQPVLGSARCGRSNEFLESQCLAHGIGQATVPSPLVVIPLPLKKLGFGVVALGIGYPPAERAHHAGILRGPILRGFP